MERIIAITGTPGVGKTRIAALLHKRVKGSVLVDVNKIINERRLYSGIDKDGAKIVRLKALQIALADVLKQNKNAKLIIVEGHILSDIKIKGAVAIVIREHIRKIMKRLKARGYPKKKINENIIAEAIDYCGANAERNYSSTYEVLSDAGAVEKIMRIISGKQKKERINLMPELLPMIKRGEVD
ncbi:MAG: AAA family ATPase [Candidatus Micrarchaeaceae archaeon]